MNRLRRFIFSLMLLISLPAIAQEEIPVVDYAGLKPMLEKQNDTLYVVNFWATWCKPCVTEMPAFNKLSAELGQQAVQFVFVSLDFPRHMDSRLKPFLKDNPLNGRVVLLDDPKAHIWIDKVSKNWSGAIPATLFYRNDARKFFEHGFDYHELKVVVNSFINN